MAARFGQTDRQKGSAALTLVEVVISIAILAVVMAGMIEGYVQTNRRAEWSSLSLAAQSFASQWAEQARAATDNELQLQLGSYTRTNSMLIPGTGQLIIVTNYVNITNVCDNPKVWQIRVDCGWQSPSMGTWFTNTLITWRGARL